MYDEIIERLKGKIDNTLYRVLEEVHKKTKDILSISQKQIDKDKIVWIEVERFFLLKKNIGTFNLSISLLNLERLGFVERTYQKVHIDYRNLESSIDRFLSGEKPI